MIRKSSSLSTPSCHLFESVQGFKEVEGSPLVCIANGGGIRADLPAGDVTYGVVTTVLPFGNTIEVLAISGEVLKEALEFAYDSVWPPACMLFSITSS